MALTKEDLQAISDLMDSKLEPIKTDIAKLNHELVPKVNYMYDCMKGVQDKFDRLDRLEDKVEDHDNRIFALEQKAV